MTFVDGERRYYGGYAAERTWTLVRGNALRYESELDARYHAYKLKDGYQRIADVSTEEIQNPRATF